LCMCMLMRHCYSWCDFIVRAKTERNNNVQHLSRLI
jgi:hypothetical protein